MQAELEALKPELEKTSAETDKIMVKVEQDSVEVRKTDFINRIAFLLVLEWLWIVDETQKAMRQKVFSRQWPVHELIFLRFSNEKSALIVSIVSILWINLLYCNH